MVAILSCPNKTEKIFLMKPISPYKDVDVLRQKLLAMIDDVLNPLGERTAVVAVEGEELPDIGQPGTISIRPIRAGAATVYLEAEANNTVFITVGEHISLEYFWGDSTWSKLVPGVREIFEAVVSGQIYVEMASSHGARRYRPYLRLADGKWHRVGNSSGSRLPRFEPRTTDRLEFEPYALPQPKPRHA